MNKKVIIGGSKAPAAPTAPKNNPDPGQNNNNQLSYEQAEALIQKEYVDKVLGFIQSDGKNKCVSPGEFIKVYEVVMYQCDSMDNGAKLYRYFQDVVKKYLLEVAVPQVNEKRGTSGVMTAYLKIWDDYAMLVKLLDRMFDYLNRYYLKNQSLKMLGVTALELFNQIFYTEVKDSFRTEVLLNFTKDRNGDIVNKDLLRDAVKCFVMQGLVQAKPNKEAFKFTWEGQRSITFYESEFEIQFLHNSRQEYEAKAKLWVASCNAPEYLQKADDAFSHEEQNNAKILEPETKPKLVNRLKQELVTLRAQQIVEKETGCKYMFDNQRSKDLELMYKVFIRDEVTLVPVIHAMSSYIETRGLKIVKDEKMLATPEQFTQELLNFKKEIDTLIETSFRNDLKFQKARDTSFQAFMNQCQQTPSFIASYTDKELKSGLKSVSNDEIDQRLSAIVRLFCCLHGRDLFLKSYQQFLSTRLLNKTSVSQEAEELMIKKLSVECGINQVNKMTQMFKDMQLSKDMQVEYSKQIKNNSVTDVELSVEVLTNGNWPMEEHPTCLIPKELKSCVDRFERYYHNKHQNRKLQWMYQFGQIELHPTYITERNYQLVVNVFQTSILSLFNEVNKLTYKEIADKTTIPKKRLDAALIALCKPGVQVLIKEIKKPIFESDAETVTLNMKFTNPAVRLQLIPAGVAKKAPNEVADQTAKENEDIERERGAVIDSKIVAIMKTNKQYRHAELVPKVMEMISMFKAQPPMIKIRIEHLIKNDYMKRDDKDKSLYIYLP